MNINEKTRKALLRFQQNEITESLLYAQLAAIEKDPSNKEVLLQIANDEKGHYTILKKYTGQEISPNKLRITKYYWLARILGITFAIKLMEGSEESAKNDYASYDEYPDLQQIARDEDEHEQRLIALINEERLEYMGSVVLGLNDALAGFTLALSDSRLIALTGSITGIAAALSMASSEYLSTKSENGNENGKHPVKASIYTGIAYIFTVVALVAPFIFISNVLMALGLMLIIALSIIALFNYYYSIARSESFRKRFTEMAVLSLSVAALSFLIGYALNEFTGIDV